MRQQWFYYDTGIIMVSLQATKSIQNNVIGANGIPINDILRGCNAKRNWINTTEAFTTLKNGVILNQLPKVMNDQRLLIMHYIKDMGLVYKRRRVRYLTMFRKTARCLNVISWVVDVKIVCLVSEQSMSYYEPAKSMKTKYKNSRSINSHRITGDGPDNLNGFYQRS